MKNRDLVLTAALAFPVFQILDLGITYFLLGFGFEEANPLFQELIYNVPLMITLKLGMGLFVAAVLYYFYVLHPSHRDLTTGIPLLVPMVVIFAGATPVLWNLSLGFYAVLAGI